MPATKSIWKIITASSASTLIEWYDFYIFGSLSTILAQKFFPDVNPTAALLSTLATFAAGFIVWPFGALMFGRLGDLIGRKYTFMLTLVLMGSATFLIGCVPAYATISPWAPSLVLFLSSQFYAQNFILTKCNIEYEQANTIILIGLVLTTPFFIVFSSLSDKWSRKNIMLAGMLLGVLLYRVYFCKGLKATGKITADLKPVPINLNKTVG